MAPYSTVLPTMMFSPARCGLRGRTHDELRPRDPCRRSRWPRRRAPASALRGQGAEALAGRAVERHRWCRPGGRRGRSARRFRPRASRPRAVDVADRDLDLDRLWASSAGSAHLRSACGRAPSRARGPALRMRDRDRLRNVRLVEQLREVEPRPSSAQSRGCLSSTSTRPTISSNVRKPSAAMISRTSSATKKK